MSIVIIIIISHSSTWENILVKSPDLRVRNIELACCRRVVELCQDCLITVYRYCNATTNQRDPTATQRSQGTTQRDLTATQRSQTATQRNPTATPRDLIA